MATSDPMAWRNPDFFVGKPILSGYEPYPQTDNAQVFSSFAPASINFVPWVHPTPVSVSNIVMFASMNASVPQASSQNSSGSEGYTYAITANLYGRQDYTSSSTNLTWLTSGFFRLTASQSYSSSSQSYGLSWVTAGTSGTSGISTTSGAGNWSSSGTGAKMLSIPFATLLPAGEYWLAFQHSSTAATSGSSVVLQSFSLLQQGELAQSAGVLGSTGSSPWFIGPGARMGMGVASAITTGGTMAISVISAPSGGAMPYFALSNA